MPDETAPTPPKPRAPKGLGRESAKFWRDVVGKYELRVDELSLLTQACRELDIIDRLEDALRDASLITKGSMGQDVPSPFLTELRQHRNTYRSYIAALKIPEPDVAAVATPTRPGTFGSEAGRAAARARHSGGAVAPRGPKAQRG